MADIESLCERIVIIRDGQFLYDGRIERILEDFRVARKQALAKTDNQPDEESNTVELEIVIEAILKKEFL